MARRNLTIRVRFALWYIVATTVSFAIFAIYTFFSVKKEYLANLDNSLVNVANSLNYIIEQKEHEVETRILGHKKQVEQNSRFDDFREKGDKKEVSPNHTDSNFKAKEEQIVWSAIYEHALSNSRNYLIQIADTNDKIVWKSHTLNKDSLPVLPDDTLWNKIKNDPSNLFSQYKLTGKPGDSIFYDLNFSKQKIRIYAKRTNSAVITIGFTLEYLQKSVNTLIKLLLYSTPIILLISILGGIFLSKFALKPIVEVINATNDITADNLKHRISETKGSDEISRLMSTLNQMIERLDQSFTRSRNFASDVSHELKTPLTILCGELEIALSNPPENKEQYEEILVSALEEVQRLTYVVNSLLELSLADLGKVKLNIEKVDLSKLVEDITEDAEILADAKRIEIVPKISKGIFCEIDKARFHQALLNIIENAIKYSYEGGYIQIALTQENEDAVIKINDTGMGIPQEQLPYIFERFYRVDKASKGPIKGSGLGLAIVKSIIDAHHAEMFVESTLDKGTAFTIYLHLVQQS